MTNNFNVTLCGDIPIMLGVKETAQRFGIAQHFARQLALTGKVRAVRAGNRILINAASVAEYFNNSTLLSESEEQKNDIRPIPVKIGG